MASPPQLQVLVTGASLTASTSPTTASKPNDDMVIEIDPEKRDHTQGGGALHDSRPDANADTNNKGQATESGPSRLRLWGQYIRPARMLAAFHEWQREKEEWWDGRYKGIRHEQINDYPCGYPQLAAFINSDVNFRVYRRFGTLHNRVLLHRQYELVKLEEELNEMDTADGEEHGYKIQSIQRPGPERQALIDTIDRKLEHYDKLLLLERESMLINRPTQRNYRNLVNFIWNEKPIVRSEIKFLNQVDDFIILANEQDPPFHALVENLIQRYTTNWFQRLFATKEQREAAKKLGVLLYSKKRIACLVHVIVMIIIFTLLTIPVYLLYSLNVSDKTKIIIVLVFLLLVLAAISLFTRARNHELFAMMAAYCAVLVVFLGNFTGPHNASNN